MTGNKIRERLRRLFREKTYRKTYMDSFLNTSIAAQIRALREARGMSQKELAEKLGTRQSGVSALENVNYSSWSLTTLRKVADAFDVALVVKFVSYGEALEEAATFDQTRLDRPSFDADPVFTAEAEGKAQPKIEAAGPDDSVSPAPLRVARHH